MFTVSSQRARTLDSAGAGWAESRPAVRRRHYKIVALCDTDLLSVVQQQLRTALGKRPVEDSVIQLAACDHDLTRLCVEFDADDCERNTLSETVRRLCTMRGLRYVRLEPKSN